MTNNVLILYVNGKRFELKEGNIDPKWTLLTFLRNNGLTGTKLGCGEGGCGACTVMISSLDPGTNDLVHYSANACLTPLCALDGHAVTTVEGIGGMKQGLHPVQQRISSAHGSQCGFCTPGIVMSIYTQLRSNPNSTPHDIEEALDGNLCRCTGYRPIIDAARSLSNNKGASGGCCRGSVGGSCPCMEAVGEDSSAVTESKAAGGCGSGGSSDSKQTHSCSENYVANQEGVAAAMESKGLTEPIFPPALMRFTPTALKITGSDVTWHQPLTMDQLMELKAAHPGARLVVGNTEVGIETKFKAMEYPVVINPARVPELRVLAVTPTEDGIIIGSVVTINRLRKFIENLVPQMAANGRAHATRGLAAIRHQLSWFASNQIRNMACVGGNIVTASPISDLNPMLIACGAMLNMRSQERGTRQVSIKDFFLSYRKVDLQPDEILESVFVPFTSEFEFVTPFKQARRREDDISIVTAGIRVRLEAAGHCWKIADCALAYGGMAPTAVHAAKTAAALIGQEWEFRNIEAHFGTLRQELSLPENVPGGQSEFRMALSVSFLFKAYLSTTTALQEHLHTACGATAATLPPVPLIASDEASGVSNFLVDEKKSTRGEQSYTKRAGKGLHHARPEPHSLQEESAETKDARESGAVGKSVMHASAESQVCGEAKYTDDIALPANAVHACLVTSTRVHARIVSVDTSGAEACPGYVAYFCAKDVVGSNAIGCVVHDEEVFVEEVVRFYGAVIGVVLANTHEEAVYAARKVVVTYEDLPAIISIQDAIRAESFYPINHGVHHGDVDQERKKAEIVVEGTGNVGGQEHFYLETNCTKVILGDNGHMEIFSSTQNCAETQQLVASVCGLPASKIVSRCKRLGGGFGGKESRTAFIACTAALSAMLLDRPVSINVERDVDMSITGQRHAFHYSYSAGCDKDGSLRFLDAKLYNNGGFSLDLSQAVMDRALMHSDNVYKWPSFRVDGKCCKTNQPSHTAFRGFGGPQGLMLCELVIEHLASVAKLDVDFMRRKNLYQEGDSTHFGTKLEQYYIPRLLKELGPLAQVDERRAAVAEFNKANRWKKRGLCVLPTKYGINFGAKFMNQGGALVHVYTDGSVLVAHGGTEMGQGLYTKVIQVAAQCFGIPTSYVTIAETATNTVANASPTAASMSTDLYGMAVLDACEQILARLQPVKARMPDANWSSIVNAAYFDRINLSAQGWYIVNADRCGYDWDKWETPNVDNSTRGMPYNYFTQGVACTEVEIDCLTGDSRILRSDVLMDLGKSINPALDIGQIEGAFVQGFGWCTMEELIWGDADHPWVRPGQLFTRGPGTYKIPAFNDVPIDFRVHLSDTDNRFAVHSSKAVGEPPFFLGCSAFFAVQDAIRSARADNGASLENFHLDLPATSERIRMACADSIAQLCTPQTVPAESFRPKGSW